MKAWAAVVGLVAVLVAAAGAAFWWYGNSRAEREVRQAVVDAGLGDKVAYDRVSYNPLTGAVTIHDIRAIGAGAGPLQPHAAALEILDWARDDDGGQTLHVRLTGLELAIEPAARAQVAANPRVWAMAFTAPPKDLVDQPLMALSVLGYDKAMLDGEIDFRYDPQDETLTLSVALDGQAMGAASLDLALAAVSPTLMSTFAGFAEKHASGAEPNALESLQMLATLKPELTRIALADLGWSYTDAGLFRRYKAFADVQTVRLTGQPSALEMSEADVNEVVTAAANIGLDPATARADALAVAAFTRDPKRLALTTHIAEPIRIAPLLDERGAQPAVAISKLITLSGAELTN